MDCATIRKWEIQSPRAELPEIKLILSLLQTMFRILEAIELSSNISTNFESGREFVKTSFGVKKKCNEIRFISDFRKVTMLFL